jgi:hypothetical protein
MGLALQSIVLLLGMHRERPLEGPVLTLGRQSVEGTPEQIVNAFASAGLVPVPLSEEMLAELHAGRLYGDRFLFALMGLTVHSLDVSAYEGADIVHDLNVPVPRELHGTYATVFDGGTLEHVFDLRTAFSNVAALTAPGGRVMHWSPCNNYVNHGFWQLSPRSFYDFYFANGFVELQSTMVVSPRDFDPGETWAAFPFDPRDKAGAVSFFTGHGERLLCAFSARKTATSTIDAVPQQSFDLMPDGRTPMRGEHYTLELNAGQLVAKRVGLA